MSEDTQDVAAIITSILRQRARQRRIPLVRRRLLIDKGLKDDFTINRHEVEVQPTFVLSSPDPIKAIDRVLNAIEEFDGRLWKERAKKINEVKSNVMQRMAYLERTLNKEDYEQFLASFIPPSPNGHSPDEAEGERFIDKDIPFSP